MCTDEEDTLYFILSFLIDHMCVRCTDQTYIYISLYNPFRYSYKQIKKMARGFKDELGKGGFGTVFKGNLRSGL